MVKKSFVIPAEMRGQRIPGQVPSLEARRILREASMPAPPRTAAMMLAHTDPRLTPESVVKGLGFDLALERSWAKFINETVGGAVNELTVRKALHEKMRQDRIGPELRSALFQRAMTYYRGRVQKSLVQLVSPDDVIKGDVKRDNAAQSANAKRKKSNAEYAKAKREEERKTRAPVGGSYHKRVTGKDGKHKYFYDPEKYASHPEAHVDGAEAQKKYITGQIHKRLEAGECGIDDFKELAKKYGADKVGECLRSEHEGQRVKFDKGRFSKPAVPMTVEKSARFIIRG